MDLKQLEQTKKQIEREILDRQELLEAYAKVEKDFQRRINPAPPVAVPMNIDPNMAGGSNEYGKNSKYVRWAIRNMHTPYSVRELLFFLEKQGIMITKDEISTVLSRLQRSEELEVHQHGAGRRPTYYKVSTSNGANG